MWCASLAYALVLKQGWPQEKKRILIPSLLPYSLPKSARSWSNRNVWHYGEAPQCWLFRRSRLDKASSKPLTTSNRKSTKTTKTRGDEYIVDLATVVQLRDVTTVPRHEQQPTLWCAPWPYQKHRLLPLWNRRHLYCLCAYPPRVKLHRNHSCLMPQKVTREQRRRCRMKAQRRRRRRQQRRGARRRRCM